MKKIVVKDLKEFAKKYDLDHVIVFSRYKNGASNIATYGDTKENCASAALWGNEMKKVLKWPESLDAYPPRFKKQILEDLEEAFNCGVEQNDFYDRGNSIKEAEERFDKIWKKYGGE